MGSLSDFKITDSDIAQNGVVAAPDKLTGTAAQNKAIFDRLIREVVKAKYNEMLSALETDISDYLGQTEEARREAEDLRAANETARVANESTRTANETARVAAETARNVWEAYDPEKQYRVGNKVAYDSSSYLCIQACTGVAPGDTAHWLLIAGKGVSPGITVAPVAGGHEVTLTYGAGESVSFPVQDGTGTGDMQAVNYDPQNKRTDVFAYADTKAPLVNGKVPAENLPELGCKSARVTFAAADWSNGTITVPAATHGITGNSVLYQFAHLVDGAYLPGTWACVESWAEIDATTHAVTLHGPSDGYAGAVTLLG